MSPVKNVCIPFDCDVIKGVFVVFGVVSILGGTGIDSVPSCTARLSNLIDSVIAINNTFCKRERERERKIV